MGIDPLPAWLNLILVLVFVGLNGFFVAAEFAYVKVRASRIDALAEEGRVLAKYAQRILRNLNAYLSACQLGITLTSLILGWLGEPTVSRLLEPVFNRMGLPEAANHTISFIIAFAVITAFHITLGEQFPKTYAIRQSEAITLWTALPVIGFNYIMYPFIWFLNGASNWLLRRSGIEPEVGHESAHTEEEIRVLMQESHKSGLIDKAEMTLMDNIFEFSETTAREIMIPRTEMACLYANLPIEDNIEIALNEMRTRFPVCDPDKDNIIGYIHIKDLFNPRDRIRDIRSILRPLTTVPESISISALLANMQRKKHQMALLIDEYGGTAGLVTVEDILEEIVGEIQDEFDEERPSIEIREEDTFSVDGLLLIADFNDYFGTEISTEEYDTIGGWVYSQVEIPPRKNDRIVYEKFEYTIEETDHLRIARLKVRKLKQDAGGLEMEDGIGA
ncbi:hemolysin family protein [Gorillibacterium sp. sgz5001074]|uniref:hemolysin family protein n=1 Tax=Gorillibacterium sp. sgz5001074 TaxID=3446695 RepID=UPI003F67F14F